MEKRIKNVYDYESYNLLLADDFAKRVAINNSYSLRSYAQDVGVSVGYLSRVFNRKTELTVATGQKIFEKLGFDREELNFIEDLVTINTTSDSQLKAELRLKINSLHNTTFLKAKTENLPMLSSIATFITYGLIRDISNLEDLLSVTNQLGLDQKAVLEAIQTLIDNDYVSKSEDIYEITEKDFQVIDIHKNFVDFGTELAQFFYEHYKKTGYVEVPKNVSSSLILGFDDESMEEVYEVHRHYIMSLLKIAERCFGSKRFVFLNVLFLEKEIINKQ